MQPLRTTIHFVSPVAAILLLASTTVDAGTFTTLEQQRSISTFVNANQCNGDFLSDEDFAKDFGPFDSSVLTEHSCDSGAGLASATQQSEIGSSSMTATGVAHSEAHGPVFGIVHAFGNSTFEVTFQLDSASEFVLTAVLMAGASDGTVLGGASILLLGPGDVTMFQQQAVPGPGGESITVEIELNAILDPGIFTLRATADTVMDNKVPPSKSIDVSFDITFDLPSECLADLTGDAVVGPADLAALLAAWGPVPTPDPPDFDGDGNVGPTDLAFLLGNWGRCP